jgi:hypothetical protein
VLDNGAISRKEVKATAGTNVGDYFITSEGTVRQPSAEPVSQLKRHDLFMNCDQPA